ncbi:MFS transporter [Natronoglycomyces albus]|uniref:MFS transporter n=1 Tax=Natronoglycomyces albus TaxID=2811108 RepID=A0A895XM48_9ACTN|nr:MFS transporter [Natronoglycomyces albus]QSB04852.1 MFS transporter [Natronoglycomyces albus]
MSIRTRLGLLRDHDYRGLFISTSASHFGLATTLIALPLTAVIALDASPLQMGFLAACQTAAFLLIGLPAGAWVDRMRRRRVLITCDLIRAGALLTVPAAWALDLLTMWQLYAVAFTLGCATVFFDVAYQSYLPHLVGRRNLPEGNAKLESMRAVSEVASPGLGGQLVALLTAPFALAVSAVGIACSALAVAGIRKREPKPEPKPDANLIREIREGLFFVVGNPILRAVVITIASFVFSSSMVMSIIMLYYTENLGLSPAMIGLISSVVGLGGILGALSVRRLAALIGQGRIIWISCLVGGPMMLLMAWAEPGWKLWLAVAGMTISSATIVIYNVTQVSFRQAITPDALLGRMNATIRFIAWGTMPIGGLTGGILGQAFGVQTTMWIGGAGLSVAFLGVFFSPLRNMKHIPTEPVEAPALVK